MRLEEPAPKRKPRLRHCHACQMPIFSVDPYVRFIFWDFCSPFCLPTYLRRRYPAYVSTIGLAGDPGVGQ